MGGGPKLIGHTGGTSQAEGKAVMASTSTFRIQSVNVSLAPVVSLSMCPYLSLHPGKYEYTLIEEKPMSLSAFRGAADDYLKRNGVKDPESASPEEIERLFWRNLGPTKEASTYGADMPGTLFQGHCSGWNMQQLDTVLMLLTGPNGENGVPGVTDPYLYIGMWAAAFAAHTEDMNLNR